MSCQRCATVRNPLEVIPRAFFFFFSLLRLFSAYNSVVTVHSPKNNPILVVFLLLCSALTLILPFNTKTLSSLLLSYIKRTNGNSSNTKYYKLKHQINTTLHINVYGYAQTPNTHNHINILLRIIFDPKCDCIQPKPTHKS